jgi:hypothetical protein
VCACVWNAICVIGFVTSRKMPRKHRPDKFCRKCGHVAHYKCGGCTYGKRVRYCCQVCQEADWGRHKATCPRDDDNTSTFFLGLESPFTSEAHRKSERAKMKRRLLKTISPGQDQEKLWILMQCQMEYGYRGEIHVFEFMLQWDKLFKAHLRDNVDASTKTQLGRYYSCASSSSDSLALRSELQSLHHFGMTTITDYPLYEPSSSSASSSSASSCSSSASQPEEID